MSIDQNTRAKFIKKRKIDAEYDVKDKYGRRFKYIETDKVYGKVYQCIECGFNIASDAKYLHMHDCREDLFFYY